MAVIWNFTAFSIFITKFFFTYLTFFSLQWSHFQFLLLIIVVSRSFSFFVKVSRAALIPIHLILTVAMHKDQISIRKLAPCQKTLDKEN